jgi:PIF1-like helicase
MNPITYEEGDAIDISFSSDSLPRPYEDGNDSFTTCASATVRGTDDNRVEAEGCERTSGQQLAGKKLGKNMLMFLEDHPLYHTHATKIVADDITVVPNFIGATLPRCDQGDREYYCSAMLALFKPWRTGKDLREEAVSWDDSFVSHPFTKRERQLMCNFNIRYECLDARDDYRAQLRKGVVSFPSWDEDVLQNLGESLTFGDQPDDAADHAANVGRASDVPVEFIQLGRAQQRRERNFAIMRSVMTNVGWTTVRPGSVTRVQLNPPQPSRILSGSEWKAEVQMKRQELLHLRSQHIPVHPNGNGAWMLPGCSLNEVKVIDKAYLEQRFHAGEHQIHIDRTTVDFGLNTAQQRAFRIVANHAASPYTDQLKLYIAGMGGTGKSQVLKALSTYFALRNQSHRFAIVAPTNSAAALLGGSTYHYMFGINEHRASIDLAQVCSRLLGVEYIFLDEVSMLSARDLYKISSSLARALDRPDSPFGGMNMLFAGDFGQLPPAVGGERVSLFSRVIGAIATDNKSQEEAIGKALWHQVNTVVILRDNMRQKSQTADDSKLRTALENMRYKACTIDDINFLKTRVSASVPSRPSVCDEAFRGVSIITAQNVHKDEINRLGSIRFASESGQSLTEFYSDDSATTKRHDSRNRAISGTAFRHLNILTEDVQKIIWEQPPCSTSLLIAGKLSLCIGMPVMIRCNAATELCITKGQEGTVYGWQSSTGWLGQRILDVLFVKLSNPPTSVKFDGLPPNVVPLSRTSNILHCSLPDDTQVFITRSQVEVLPNFAMTDYASQGKTRVSNVVDLHNSRTHQSYYTALSRSASAAGTCILQGFDPRKITGGASGSLRQEFREVELLDEITRLRFQGKLHKSVIGDRRNELIKSFRDWKGRQYVPQTVHKAIRWSPKDPLNEPEVEDLPWRIVRGPHSLVSDSQQPSKDTPKDTSALAASVPQDLRVANAATASPEKESASIIERHRDVANTSTINTPSALKRKVCTTDIPLGDGMLSKKIKLISPIVSRVRRTIHRMQRTSNVPIGLQWSENSCAYDSVFIILHRIWASDPDQWVRIFNSMNTELLGSLATDFSAHATGSLSLEASRDRLRLKLQHLRNNDFRWGCFTSLSAVLSAVLTTPFTVTVSEYVCPHNHAHQTRASFSNTSCMLTAGNVPYSRVAEWIHHLRLPTRRACSVCQRRLLLSTTFRHIPYLLAVDLSGQRLIIDTSVTISQVDGGPINYMLAGVMYYGANHFTSRIVESSQLVWFHDGVETGRYMEYEGTIDSLGSLSHCRGKSATAAIYVRRSW